MSRDYQRDLNDLVDATEFIQMYAAKLRVLALGQVSAGPTRSHEHMLATKSTLLAYARTIEDMLKSPAAEHETCLRELVVDIEAHLLGAEFGEEYDSAMTVEQVCLMVAAHVGNDVRAVSDYLTLRKLEESL